MEELKLFLNQAGLVYTDVEPGYLTVEGDFGEFQIINQSGIWVLIFSGPNKEFTKIFSTLKSVKILILRTLGYTVIVD